MVVLDRPGSLLGALKPFADRGINLHKLESRPLRGKPFEYLMYVDLVASGDTDDVREALDEVRAHTSMLRVLGTYASANDPG
ncbi:MAG: ACT domain-containing protein [Actinomycetota bacterium]